MRRELVAVRECATCTGISGRTARECAVRHGERSRGRKVPLRLLLLAAQRALLERGRAVGFGVL